MSPTEAVTFVTGSDPFDGDWGDKVITRLLIEAAAETATVRVVALSEAPASNARGPVDVAIVPKPPLRLPLAAARSLARRRSVIHDYFRVPELTEALRGRDDPLLVAEHTYMAESPLAAGAGSPGGPRLLINTHVLESTVLAERRSPVSFAMRLEARRTWRDELRCIRRAESAVCLGEDDLARLSGEGAHNVLRLDLLLPPAQRAAQAERPRAVFMGTRHGWAPNQDAFRRVLGLWPRIREAVPGAELLVTGKPARSEPHPSDPSVRVVGYVDDLDELLSTSTVLLAPVTIGGGVRVKVLEAARHGLPVVGTPAAIGTVGEYLPVSAAADDEEFVAAAVELLAQPALARERGNRLYDANHELWESGFVQKQVESWLAPVSSAPNPVGDPDRG